MGDFEALSRREQVIVRRILKVNHAGEYGAIRIYRAQLTLARRFYPDLVAFLETTLAHEVDHCARFAEAMKHRNTRACRVMSLWGNGGYVLGFMTAVFGRKGIWICTSAVEATVHRHLLDQLAYLESRDTRLRDLIADIQVDEIQHLDHANRMLESKNAWSNMLDKFVAVVTDVLIWLSTWGASTNMGSGLRRNQMALPRRG